MECLVWNTEIVNGGNDILTPIESKKIALGIFAA